MFARPLNRPRHHTTPNRLPTARPVARLPHEVGPLCKRSGYFLRGSDHFHFLFPISIIYISSLVISFALHVLRRPAEYPLHLVSSRNGRRNLASACAFQWRQRRCLLQPRRPTIQFRLSQLTDPRPRSHGIPIGVAFCWDRVSRQHSLCPSSLSCLCMLPLTHNAPA